MIQQTILAFVLTTTTSMAPVQLQKPTETYVTPIQLKDPVETKVAESKDKEILDYSRYPQCRYAVDKQYCICLATFGAHDPSTFNGNHPSKDKRILDNWDQQVKAYCSRWYRRF